MSSEKRADLAIVGAGIIGLAHAWHGARLGKKVVVLERSPQPQGASVRNFGLIWPIAQPSGFVHQTALRSRELWVELLNTCKLPYAANGCLFACYHDEEESLGKEFCSIGPQQGYTCEWLDAKRARERSEALRQQGLRGAVYSPNELMLDPRVILRELPRLLAERYRVEVRFRSPVRKIALPTVETAEETWKVDQAIVCTGHDFETLFPGEFKSSGLTRCKLQMLQTVPQPDGWKLGPALAGGLSMAHYPSFRMCSSYEALRKRIASKMHAYERWGIHVLVSQTEQGELTIGDSHEYGPVTDFADKAEIEELQLEHLDSFALFPDRTIAHRWHGVYAYHPEKPFFVATPEKGCLIVTGLGGSGMTLSLGLAERVTKKFFEGTTLAAHSR